MIIAIMINSNNNNNNNNNLTYSAEFIYRVSLLLLSYLLSNESGSNGWKLSIKTRHGHAEYYSETASGARVMCVNVVLGTVVVVARARQFDRRQRSGDSDPDGHERY